MQPIQLNQVPNFRDVGQTVNHFLGQKRIREGVIYRSARPGRRRAECSSDTPTTQLTLQTDDATPEDKRVIRDELKIKTIIDLRTK